MNVSIMTRYLVNHDNDHRDISMCGLGFGKINSYEIPWACGKNDDLSLRISLPDLLSSFHFPANNS
jgi:hypothetical protein